MTIKDPCRGLALLAVLSISCGGGGAVPGPSVLTAEPSPGSKAIHVTWVDNREGEMSYELERKDSGAYRVIVTLPFNSDTHHDDDPALAQGTVYTYRVRAKLADGTFSAYSKTATSQPGGG